MTTSRRAFLTALLAAPVAASAPEIWVPTRKFFLPPRGGWDLSFHSTDLLLTLDDFARKYMEPALKVMARQIEDDLYRTVDREYGDQWKAVEIQAMTVRKPARYEPNIIRSLQLP